MGVSYPYYGSQPQFMQPPPQQQQPPVPMPVQPMQTPVQQAAQQPQQGDIWSDLSTFSRTPQGQQALLAFANAAMQNSMNPQTGGGAGFINAVGSGMQGYKAAEEYQDEKAWRTESRTAQRKEWKQKELTDPLELRKLTAQIATLEAPPEGKYKRGDKITTGAKTKDGRNMEVDLMYLGGDPADMKNSWKIIGTKESKETANEAKPLDMLNYQEIAAGIVKHPSITPQAAQALIDQMARSPYGKRQAATQMALKDDRWYQTEGNSVARNSLIDEYESYITPVKNPGIVDVTGERAKATAAIAAAKGNATAIANIKAAYRAKTGQELK